MGWLIDAVSALFSIMPSYTMPYFIIHLPENGAWLGDHIGGVGNWVAWDPLLTVAPICLAALLLVNAVKLGLFIWSKLPIIGK